MHKATCILTLVIISCSGVGGRDDEPPEISLPDGFEVDVLYHASAADSSSWVSLTMDGDGQLIASDQYGSLYRIDPAPAGSDPSETMVEKLDIVVGHAQGLLWAFDALYVVVNSEEGVEGNASGLYRLTDTNDDEQPDSVYNLATFEGFGEHGPHAVILSPDSASLYVIAGNHTELPETYRSIVPPNWAADGLSPPLRDPRGHAADRPPPGGWIARTDPMGKNWDLVSVGFRNAYDIAFNTQGDLFTFDSDMEWDLGMPWYRPVRVLHVTSGSEFGWRTGSGKWPAYYPDNLPSVVDVGQGSPTGVLAAAGAAFPRRYQSGLFVFDWSFGTIYWVGLQSRGSSYEGELEEFLSGIPLPVTDGVIGQDGALYFATGGRRLDSWLFRVRYAGPQAVSPPPAEVHPSAQHALRNMLEAFHGRVDPAALGAAWPHLAHADRFVRYAARIAVEHQPVQSWQQRALSEPDPVKRMYAVIALARNGSTDLRDQAFRALLSIDEASLSRAQQLDLLRAYGLVMIRMGAPEGLVRDGIIRVLDARYPTGDEVLNRERGLLLTALEAPGIAEKMVGRLATLSGHAASDVALIGERVAGRSEQYGQAITDMRTNMPQVQEIDIAMNLRHVQTGWTLELRQAYFGWFYDALRKSGGMSYVGFLENMRADALEHVPAADREALADLTDAYTERAWGLEDVPQPVGPPRQWNRQEIFKLMEHGMNEPRSLDNGRTMYAAALCQACHRFGDAGGLIGPDLTTVGSRFSRGDLLEAIDSPSFEISDQYAADLISLSSEQVIIGRVVAEVADSLWVNQNPYDPDQQIVVRTADIDAREKSSVSIMPPRLLNRLNGEEVLDLLAYLISGSDPDHVCYTHENGCEGDDTD